MFKLEFEFSMLRMDKHWHLFKAIRATEGKNSHKRPPVCVKLINSKFTRSSSFNCDVNQKGVLHSHLLILRNPLKRRRSKKNWVSVFSCFYYNHTVWCKLRLFYQLCTFGLYFDLF